VRRLMGNDPGITWVLQGDRQRAGFWEQLSFRLSAIAMERMRMDVEALPGPVR